LKNGGVWWGGNLKGLLYSLVWKYGEDILSDWDIGLMTYDLGCKEGSDCGNGLPFDCSLVDQVSYYVNSYKTYMKNGELEQPQNKYGDFKDVVPKYFNVNMRTFFGFEIGHPAYPAYDDSWKKMIARESDVTSLFEKIGDSNEGVIVWEMFKATESTYSDEASTKFVLETACKSYELGSNYDCKANIPNPPSFIYESLFL